MNSSASVSWRVHVELFSTLPWTSTTGGPEPVRRTWNAIAGSVQGRRFSRSDKRVWGVTSSALALVCSRRMEPSPRSSFQPAGAGGLLLAATAACTGVGAAVGAAAGSAGLGALAGAAVGIPVGHLRRLPPLQRGLPRDRPHRLDPRARARARSLPLAPAGAVIALALPVFLIAGWPLAGWALGAVLWVGGELLGLLLHARARGSDNLAASGVLGVGMMFRGSR